MSSKKQKSVLAADTTKAVAAPVVSATGYATARFDSKGFRSDNWNYADDEVVMDVNGNYITFGELKKRKAGRIFAYATYAIFTKGAIWDYNGNNATVMASFNNVTVDLDKANNFPITFNN